MTDIRIVPVDEKYAASYGECLRIVAGERKYLATTTGFPLSRTVAFVRKNVKNNHPQYFAICEEKVIGWCDISPRAFEGLSHAGELGMGILPEYRGKGIGAMLLDTTIKHAKEHSGLEKVELEVFESNTNAIRLYETYGFVREGIRVDSRKIDGKYDNIVLMGKKI